MSTTWWNSQRIPPLSLILAGQEIAMPFFGAAEEGRDLLGPLERRVKRPGPADGVVRIRLVVTPGF
jgi:hypothetical protein